MSAKHQKHPKLAKPTFEQFARYEIGVLGAPCGVIESLCNGLYKCLEASYKTIYVDADHGSGNNASITPVYKDMISHHRIDHNRRLNDWEQKVALRSYDLALVNSNHFDAKSQLVIINTAKEASLRRKVDRLTDIRGFILDREVEEPFEWLYEYVDSTCPIFNIDDIDGIAELLKAQIAIPEIHGLVLAGGKSSRMGVDKSQITYHNGMAQESYMIQELSTCIGQVYLSKRELEEDSEHNIIVDSFQGLGPFGAILSAFRKDPNAAWMVTACDQPLLGSQHIDELITQRDPSKVATCYYNPDTDFPEPLITLWEPKAYPIMLQYLALGNSCPRKVLINSDICLVKVDDTTFMKNANTPKEREEAIKILN